MAEETSAITNGVPERVDAASLPEETGPAALSSGTRIGGYEIGRCLGFGSMGAVYEGVHVDDRKPVAIKLLAADLAESPAGRARFLNEAKLAARISHPHVVAVIDSGEEEGRAYLVMDLLEGEDLERRLRRSGPMSAGEAIEVLGPVCDALAAAHRAGVTHRDLKPSNIFLAVREGHPHVMLLDFGVATDEDEISEADRTATWNGIGTPMYLAPELVTNRRQAGPASDQYALGAILCEMLTGEPPYAADDLQQLLHTIAIGPPPSARARRPEISAELEAVVLRAMSTNPEDRFASMEELAQALRPFAAAPDGREQLGRRRPPSSPAIALEAATPSPFVRTLVPEHQAKSGPWFVAPDAHEIPEDDDVQSTASDSLEAGPFSAETAGRRLEDEAPIVGDESPTVEDESRTLEAPGSRVKGDTPVVADPSPGKRRFSWPGRTVLPIDWQRVSSFTTKHRRAVVASAIGVVAIALLVIRPGHSASRPILVAPAAAPAAVGRAEPAPAAPPSPASRTEPTAPPRATVEKTAPTTPLPATVEEAEQAPVAPPANTITNGSPAPAPAAAAADTVEKTEPARAAQPVASTVLPRTNASEERPKVGARRVRPVPPRTLQPGPKVPSPATEARDAPIRMHNGVPLLE